MAMYRRAVFMQQRSFTAEEGGAAITTDTELYNKIFYKHNFGHKGSEDFYRAGINAKISELQSAMGLSVLFYMDHIFAERKRVVDFYNRNLTFSNYRAIVLREGTDWNFSYYPIIFDSESAVLNVVSALNRKGINPRRYFYPSLNTVEYINGDSMPISERIASCILCLPLYDDLSAQDLRTIVETIDGNLI